MELLVTKTTFLPGGCQQNSGWRGSGVMVPFDLNISNVSTVPGNRCSPDHRTPSKCQYLLAL